MKSVECFKVQVSFNVIEVNSLDKELQAFRSELTNHENLASKL